MWSSVKGYKKGDLLTLAEELDEEVNESFKLVKLKEIISANKEYLNDPEFVKNRLLSIIEDRKAVEELAEKRRLQEIELAEKRRLEELELDEKRKLEELRINTEEKQQLERINAEKEIELARIAATSHLNLNGNDNDNSSLESLIKSVNTLTMAVPNCKDNWPLYFSSLEKAFAIKNVPEEYKTEILLNLLGENIAKVLVNISEDDLKNYEKVKTLILKEYQPTAQACLKRFRQARKNTDESYVQFATRIMAQWKYYCKLREAQDLETIHELIVSDKLLSTLEDDVASHINLKQGDTWLKPNDMAKECDIYLASKPKPANRGANSTHESRQSEYEVSRYVPPHMRNQERPNNKKLKKACYICGSENHLARFCHQRLKHREPNNKPKNGLEKSSKTDALVAKISTQFGTEEQPIVTQLKHEKILIEGKEVSAVIDSGTQIPVVHKDILPDHVEVAGRINLISAFGNKIEARLAKLRLALKDKYFDYACSPIEVFVAVTDELSTSCLLPPETFELLKETADVDDGIIDVMTEDKKDEMIPEVELEMQGGIDMMKEKQTLSISEDKAVYSVEVSSTKENEGDLSDVTKFKEQQRACPSLKEVRDALKLAKGNFTMIDGLIYHEDKVNGDSVKQLVLPLERRKDVLRLAHESVFGAHMGMKKTKERIRYNFYWPNMSQDVAEFCNTCESCQLRTTAKMTDRVPITPVLRPELPFEVVNIDIIGPIEPTSARKYKYVLCLVDQHTRWPEAIPLRSLTAKSTCDALLEIFSRTGIPKIIASDQGTNFISKLTQEFLNRLGCHPRFSVPGYPASNGLVERFNRTLKNALHHVIRTDPGNWDKQIPYILFAYREVANVTTGVSPFKLMYGREVRGPLSVLKSSWSGEIPIPLNFNRSIVDYLQEMKINLEMAAEMARNIASEKQTSYANYFNLRTRHKEFNVGDLVYLLIPDSTNKLYARWTGPGEIIRYCPPHSYQVKLADGKVKHVHVNKIKKFHARVNAVGVIFENEEEFGEVLANPVGDAEMEKCCIYNLEDVDLTHLPNGHRRDIQRLLRKYETLFSNKVRIAKVGEHKIRLMEVERKKPYIYRIPEILKPKVDEQVKELLNLGLIEESEAEIAYPVVCVMKKDGTVRLCVDYRALNAVTKPDDFPMENATELMYCIGRANIITTLDLLKGYWAIPMEKASQPLTSFKTHRAQYCFKVMPFGLRNAAATFQRVMNKALEEFEFARAYIDDIAVFSPDWETHLQHLDLIFAKLKELCFSVHLKKCSFAKSQVKYLGHIIGSGKHQTDPEKILAIQKIERPFNKKQLKSFLGLCNYYREYIAHYAEIAFPLTELTKKNSPDSLPWSDAHEKAFCDLKKALAKTPSLHTPKIGLPFVIQCDASLIGIGACLSQRKAEKLYPISFASQKLSKSQQAWPAIEREAYAVIWSLKKFETWVFGSKIELITDHNPLTYITKSAPQSSKLQRWALALQKYDLTVTHCPGSKLNNADALSRLPMGDVTIPSNNNRQENEFLGET